MDLERRRRPGGGHDDGEATVKPALVRRHCLKLAAAVCLWRGEDVAAAAGDPAMPQADRDAYADFLLADLHRAIAVPDEGPAGLAFGAATQAEAATAAVADCRAKGGRRPRLLAVDLAAAGAPAPPAPPAPPLLATWNYAFVADPRFLWRGPAAARGVYVWAHGSSSDPTGHQPPPHVRAFNNAGYDIVRFDREPMADDLDRADDWLKRGLRTLRARGWKRLIAAGHSRGGWNALDMLATPGLADAVIAESPAAHGMGDSTLLYDQIDDLRALVAGVPASAARLAFIQFEGDMYAMAPDQRAALVRRLQGRLAGLLMIDRPAGFSGHFAGTDLRFARLFAPALVRFAG